MFSSGYKVILCLMRKYVTLDDRVNAPIAGFISALSVAFETNSRKSLFTILVVSRCIDSVLNYLESEGYLSTNKNLRYFWLWCISSTFVVFLHMVRPELVNPGLLRLYTKFAMRSYNEQAMFDYNERLWKGRANFSFY